MTYSDGTLYTGKWKGDKRHGYGEMKYAHGRTTYKGEFKDGLKHGQGLYKWADGAWYDGHFEEDRENGLGTYHFSNGDEYTVRIYMDYTYIASKYLVFDNLNLISG